MSVQSPLDLYNVIVELGDADWIDEIRIFRSRRYLSNSSYGSNRILNAWHAYSQGLRVALILSRRTFGEWDGR
jgi:hypothetical protein